MATFRCNRYPQLVVKFSDRSRVRFDRKQVEVEGEVAERLDAFARQHPEYEIERVDDGSDEKPLTPKQQAVARAEELGLDTSGSKSDIEARIAAFEADDEPVGEDDADDDEIEDESDADGSDDA